ncbi:la-related protein 6-like [Uloborus diversus]|uniref:la-related protein 6-like n=1 Tax=Uloborus diversus TaxID=327109 RepID=UPI0024099587|nr:la-related protein 6-like [Uloborus diversus]XP_054724709.1 la-related protein 6-like [Uloborus diversus]
MVEVATVDTLSKEVSRVSTMNDEAAFEKPATILPPSLMVDDADDDSSNPSEEGGANMSDSDPKDSGIDCSSSEHGAVESLDEETATTIMKTVEFYLSDTNILKDPFLLKHVRRNKEGYVSVKLLASFRKVRTLCRNWKAVAQSVQKSQLLALNDEGTKVRRLSPLPDHDETVTSRSVIVHGFSTDKPSVDSVSEMFSKCGDIALVRILRPGGSVPTDVKRFLSKNPDIQSKICALVEFEEHASAKKALDIIQSSEIKVVPLLMKEKNKTESPKKVQKSTTDSDEKKSEPTTPAKESPKKKKKNRKSSSDDRKIAENAKNLSIDDLKRNRRSGSMSSQSSGYLSSSPVNNQGNFLEGKYPRRHSFNPSIYNDPNSSFASLSSRYNGSRDRLQKTGIAEATSTGLSPWRRRKEQMMQSDTNLSSTTTPSGALLQSLPVKTIRSPKGPDGTKGFSPVVRSRLPSTAEETLPAQIAPLISCKN